MLSYRHSYHAGNFADVLKHLVLVEILQYLKRKNGAFDYIDTHAGAGLYSLQSIHASKLAEYRDGIARLNVADWPELAGYLGLIESFNPGGELLIYPGSPAIAHRLLRPQDRASLFELHPADFAELQQLFHRDRRVRTFHEDGHKGLLRLLPPKSRRAVVLVDPSYEVKTEYAQLVQTLAQAWRRFPAGVYALWYPVIDRQRSEEMIAAIAQSGIRDIQRYELGVAADSAERGMTACGMLVINPPWTLQAELAALLPRLAQQLRQGEGAYSRVEVVAGE
ncbi:MAG TPA: 23S rRNA (adenine(2030)-N(6))-methyltransferase RlmJ [Xanthomonadales bacterium]|nr:23S rRNA (adenine(2030)-N(6))-methyltransferase RlmJ [Xanthomonadales bacterium]